MPVKKDSLQEKKVTKDTTGPHPMNLRLQRPRGLLAVIEGIDGTGKSTLARGLFHALKARGLDVVLDFEPTHGAYGKKLRESFKGPKRLSPEEELILFNQDRREHVKDVIIPYLNAGKIIILDRYYLSTMAYQGALGLDPEKIRKENEAFSPRPDVAFVLGLSPEKALERIISSRKERPNAFEGLDYLKRVKAIFDSMDMEWIIRLDASKPPGELVQEAKEAVMNLLQG